jgi:SAM-dependent methyltransferase
MLYKFVVGGGFKFCSRLSVQMASPAPAAGAGLRHAVEYHAHDFDFDEVVPQGTAALASFEEIRQPDEAVGRVAKRSYKSWQQFHFQHDGKFFHPRLYATEAFPELLAQGSATPDGRHDLGSVSAENPLLHVFEVGCGNGSNVFPILERNPRCFVYATDFSPAALKTIVQNPKYSEVKDRCAVFLWDALSNSADAAASKVGEPGEGSPRSHEYDWGTVPTMPLVDIAVCMFVLSALHPRDQLTALKNIAMVSCNACISVSFGVRVGPHCSCSLSDRAVL